MNWANPSQKFQDWFTQQWVIFWGQKIDPTDVPWLMGPFGKVDGIGENFIYQLAADENLTVERNSKSRGLINSLDELNFSEGIRANLSKRVVDFYKNTSEYALSLSVNWNPFFRVVGVLVNRLFSHRINQLNVPTDNKKEENLNSEIVTLISSESGDIKYTIWLRTSTRDGQVIYSGIYGTCKLPSGKSCIKAVFPLPQGNATVILTPSVGTNGELILEASGRKFGDAGFYFLLKDSKGGHWAQFISSFRDRLTIYESGEVICAEQYLTLWKQKILGFNYQIHHMKKPKDQPNDFEPKNVNAKI